MLREHYASVVRGRPLGWAPDSNFVVGRYDQAAAPLIDRLRRKQHGDARDEGLTTRPDEAYKQQSRVCPGRVPADVGEV